MKLFICLFALVAMTMGEEEDLLRQLRTGNDHFTSKMFAEVVKNNPNKSVVLSAFSVLTPLAQLSLAAEGESHDELLRAIGLPNDNVTRAVFPLINGKLRAVKGVELKTASKIYIPNGYELDERFAADSKSVFGSEVKNVDFVKNVEAAAEINTWVEDQTNHRIKDLVSADSLDSLTRAVLVNAIYFKGSWKNKFDTAATVDRDFHVSKDKTIKVPTMYKKDDFRYGESKELDAKLLELPYEGGETSFLVVLPNAIDGLPALQEKLKDPAALEKAYDEMFTVEVEVYLPKFKIETTTDLKDVLSKIGVSKIFGDATARLEHLLKTKEKLYVSEAIQKAFIEVNEEGAEAAAANEFGIVAFSSLVRPKKYVFDANHPFVFSLRETKTPLFEGVYSA